jgi:hypothetical protein
VAFLKNEYAHAARDYGAMQTAIAALPEDRGSAAERRLACTVVAHLQSSARDISVMSQRWHSNPRPEIRMPRST